MESTEGEPNLLLLQQKPCLTFKQPDSLHASGFELVLTQAVYAIVGAVALERGGGEANRIVRERMIAPLGVRSQVLEDSKPSQLQ